MEVTKKWFRSFAPAAAANRIHGILVDFREMYEDVRRKNNRTRKPRMSVCIFIIAPGFVTTLLKFHDFILCLSLASSNHWKDSPLAAFKLLRRKDFWALASVMCGKPHQTFVAKQTLQYAAYSETRSYNLLAGGNFFNSSLSYNEL